MDRLEAEAEVMRTEDEKDKSLKAKHDTYDAAVLQFLDQEITTASKISGDPAARRDEVDVMVENLLQESINVSEPVQVDQDTGVEDLDRLFSRIFKEYKPALRTDVVYTQSAACPTVNEIPKEISPVERKSVATGAAERLPRQEAAAAVPVEVAAAAPFISRPADILPTPMPPFKHADEVQTNYEDETVLPLLDEMQPDLVFTPPLHTRVWNLRMALILAASLCLLAGAGIVMTKNSSNKSPARVGPSSAPAAPTAPTTPATSPVVEEPSTVHPPLAPATEIKPAMIRAARNADNLIPAATPNNGPAVNRSMQPREGKPAPAALPAPASIINAPATRTVPADAARKEVSKVAAAPENPAALSSQRTAETAPPPPAPQIQAVPAAALSPLIPKAAADLEDSTTARRPVIPLSVQPPAIPKRATPAIVISRVLPIYPEMARISHTTGTVVVDVLVDEKGTVTKATAVSGPAVLQLEAVNAVMRWRFRPANLDGVAVPSSSQVSIIFK